ncbi:hypothetical protein ACFX2I_006438 [Malus domestica]
MLDRDGVVFDLVFVVLGVDGGDWLVELGGGCIVVVIEVGVRIASVLVIYDLDDVRRSCGVHRRLPTSSGEENQKSEKSEIVGGEIDRKQSLFSFSPLQWVTDALRLISEPDLPPRRHQQSNRWCWSQHILKPSHKSCRTYRKWYVPGVRGWMQDPNQMRRHHRSGGRC